MNLEQKFLELCRSLPAREDVLYTEEARDKHMTRFSLYFRVCRVELVYSRKWETVAPPSVLYCRVYLSKNDPIYLHLPELMAYLGAQDYRACYFPYIESPERLEACFRALMCIVEDYIPQAERLGTTGQDRVILERWADEGFFEDPKGEEPQQGEIDRDTMAFVRVFQESVLVARHTNLDAYEAFLKGDREKALQKYEKLAKNGLSLYEKGLCDFLRSEESRDFRPMSAECFAAPAYKKATGQKADLKGMALLYAGFAVLFCGLLAVLNAVYARGTVYYLGVPWWTGLIWAGLPAIFGYFVFQRRIQKLLGGSVDFLDALKPHPWINRLAAVIFAAATVGSAVLCIWLSGNSMRFYADRGIYCTEEDSAREFAYSEVQDIYFIRSRYNDYGNRVDRSSYVIVLADGTRIDLDASTSLEKQRQIVEELFPALEIRELDSDRELP